MVVGLAYIVIADKWAEHKLRQTAVEAKAEKERRSSDIPDAEAQGAVENWFFTYASENDWSNIEREVFITNDQYERKE